MLRCFVIMLLIVIMIDEIATANKKKISLLKQKERKSSKRTRKGSGSRTPLWPDGVVYYKIDSTLSSHRSKIQAAMKHIQGRTCLQFKQRAGQSNYVQFFNGDGCYSSVGRVGGRQYLSLGRGCHDVGSAMHEILHALGLYHEHMRSDRDQYISINWENIEKGMEDQFVKISKSTSPLLTKFDYSSIMIYGNKAFSKNGRKTMTPKVKGARMIESHFKKSLSASDVATLNKLYNCQ